MASHLLLYPVSDVGEASTGVAVGEVVDPSPEYRVDLFDHLLRRLRSEGAKDCLECLQELRALLHLGGPQREPLAGAVAHAPDVEPQVAKALSPRQVHGSALLFVDLDFKFGQFLP